MGRLIDANALKVNMFLYAAPEMVWDKADIVHKIDEMPTAKSKKESKVWRICNAYMTRHMTAPEAMARIIDIMKEKNLGKK